MADVWGIIPYKGHLVHVEIEIKTGNARQSKAQKAWEKFIKEMGGVYVLAREPDQTIADLRFQIYGTPKKLQ